MIRAAAVEDADRIAEIHVYGWRFAYRGILDDPYLFSRLSVTKRAAQLAKAIGEGLEETCVFDDEGIVKAFMTIGRCRNDDKPDAFELWGIYVEPQFKNSGIGRAMVEYCEARARERGFGENALWVLEKNADARKFYERMGYLQDGKEETIERLAVKEIRYTKRLA